MYCKVYQLRRHGNKLDRIEIRETEIIGAVHFGNDSNSAQPRKVAKFTGSDGRGSLPPLFYADVVKIDRGGFLIRGVETVYPENRTLRCTQVWWCVPVEEPPEPEEIPAWRRGRGDVEK